MVNNTLNSLLRDKQKFINIISTEYTNFSNLNTFSDLIPYITKNMYYYTPTYFSYRGSSLTSISFPNNFKTDNIINMSGMFLSCDNLTSLDIFNWNVSNVIDMHEMFYYCENLTALNISNWNTSNVTNMYSMFYYCKNLTSLDISNWNTSNVTNMYSMFEDCRKLTSLNLSNWDTSNVTDMDSMFSTCNYLVTLDVSNWNTSNVKSMRHMFHWTEKANNIIGINSWNTYNLTDTSYMFYGCYYTKLPDLSNWNVNNLINIECMFGMCSLDSNEQINICKMLINAINIDPAFKNLSSSNYDSPFYEGTSISVSSIGEELYNKLMNAGWHF